MLDARYIGAEWRAPPLDGFLEPSFFLPILFFFLIFNIVGQWVQSHLWKGYSAFEKYRLKNTTVSLVHSAVTGCIALMFMLVNPNVMFDDTLHWYNAYAAQLVHFSMAYFCYDAFDIVRHERTRYACELVIHHVVVNAIFSTGMLSHKFLPFAYWALLVEVNSIFLHIRTIMNLARLSKYHSAQYRVTRILSIGTFIVFRFGVLIWMFRYIVSNRRHFHAFFTYAATLALAFFIILSCFLFVRILAEDGILSARHAINRYSKEALLYERNSRKTSCEQK